MSKIINKSSLLRTLNRNMCKYAKNAIGTTDVISKRNLNVDLIGQPDKNSNLRPVKFYTSPHETKLQKEYRELRLDTQEWNQQFWSGHNQRFIKEREDFVSSHKKEGESTMNADQMSVFYKNFLDSNWKSHVAYNIEWYKRNLQILRLAIKVNLERKWLKIKNINKSL